VLTPEDEIKQLFLLEFLDLKAVHAHVQFEEALH
jgi:hypothetical protein